RIEDADDAVAEYVRKRFHLGERTDPHAVDVAEPVEVLWHGLRADDGDNGALAAHIRFQLFHPVLRESLGPLAFINDAAALLAEVVADGEDAIGAFYSFSDFCDFIEGKGVPEKA